jgi:hypothetical protein
MNAKLREAIARLDRAHRRVCQLGRTYGPDTDDPKGIAAWDAVIEELKCAERHVLAEALVAYELEQRQC